MKLSLSCRTICLALVAAALAACVETNPKPAATQSLTPPVIAVPADPTLTHRYSFTADAKDSVGKVDGKLMGSAKIAGGKLVIEGGALPGSDSANLPYLEFAGPILPATGNASIALWFSASETSTLAPRLLDIGDREGAVGHAFLYFAPHFGSSETSRAKISATDSSSGTPVDGPRLDDNKPHLVVIALSASEMHVFIDGAEPVAAAQIGGNNLAAVKQVHSWIGRSGFDQDPGITASIDEVRTYNRTLTLADAAALSKAGPDAMPK